MDRYERINALHRILKGSRYPVTVARLQDELECSRATVYRDLAFLRDALMAPIVGDGEAGFRCEADEGGRFELPGLWLNSDELHALLAAQQLLSRSSGGVLLEVSQGRQPCWKLNDRFGVPAMARRVQDSGRTGWYYRVLQPGSVQAGDALVLVARPLPQWPLARIIAVLYHQPFDAAVLQALAALPLTPSWQRLVQGRLARGAAEDWQARLDGPPPQG